MAWWNIHVIISHSRCNLFISPLSYRHGYLLCSEMRAKPTYKLSRASDCINGFRERGKASWWMQLQASMIIISHVSFRFWETDIRAARKINRSTIRRKNTFNKSSWVLEGYREENIIAFWSDEERMNGAENCSSSPCHSTAICTFQKTLTPHYCKHSNHHLSNISHSRLFLWLSPSLQVRRFIAGIEEPWG